METYLGTPREPNLSDEMNEAIMRSVIRHIRTLLRDPQDMQARSELMWASAMAENGLLKLGKTTDFQFGRRLIARQPCMARPPWRRALLTVI